MPISPQHIGTFAILLLMILALYKEWWKPVIVFGIGATSFLFLGSIDAKELLSGFANEQVAVIILLLIISSVIEKAKLLEHGLNSVFAGADSYKKFIRRLVPFTAAISGFLNNTPVVASFIPYVFIWGKKNGIAPSKVLMPLSFAAILGGTMTLIGTSTNLIVNGLAQENGFAGFELFDFAFIGVPLVIVGALYMLVFGDRLLPNHGDPLESFKSSTKEYLVETRVVKGSPLIDKTVEGSDMRSLDGLFLVEIIRGKRKIGPVKPTQNIREGDHLIFAGDTEDIPNLMSSQLGLELPALKEIQEQELIQVVEAVLSYNSNLAGKKVRETDFRGTFDAAIVAIHRNGEKLSGKIGDIVLENGDLLVLMTGKDFRKRINRKSFYLLSSRKEIPNINKAKSWTITLSALLAIVLAAFKVLSLFKLLLIYVAISLLLKWIRPGELQKSLDLNLAFIAALSLAVGHAMENSGTAQLIAHGMSNTIGAFGPIGILAGVYIITNVLTEFVTNVAAATLGLPIALSLATSLQLPVEPFVLCVAFAASFSFLSPIGYQTNLMVFGPGGYRFKDFIRFGMPLSFLCFLFTISLLVIKYDLL